MLWEYRVWLKQLLASLKRQIRPEEAFPEQLAKPDLEELQPLVLMNVAPVANDDFFNTGQNTAKIFNVLANDFDADFNVISIISTSSPAHGALTGGFSGN